jgi:hypothetical protein
MTLPLISDFFNRRAKTRHSASTWLDAAKIAVPAVLGGIFTVMDLALKILAPLPGAALIVQAGVPAALMLVSAFAISSRVEEVEGGGFPASPKKVHKYRFTEPERITAKIALLPLVALAFYNVANVTPNALFRRSHTAGFICRASDGSGVTDGVVEVLDAAGGVVSNEPQQLDDTGFFFSELRRWGGRPHSVRLSSPSCPTAQFLIRDSTRRGLSCPRDDDKRVERPDPYEIWMLTCK